MQGILIITDDMKIKHGTWVAHSSFNIFQRDQSCTSFCGSLRRLSVGGALGWWVMLTVNISCLDKAYLVKGCEHRRSGLYPPLPTRPLAWVGLPADTNCPTPGQSQGLRLRGGVQGRTLASRFDCTAMHFTVVIIFILSVWSPGLYLK